MACWTGRIGRRCSCKSNGVSSDVSCWFAAGIPVCNGTPGRGCELATAAAGGTHGHIRCSLHFQRCSCGAVSVLLAFTTPGHHISATGTHTASTYATVPVVVANEPLNPVDLPFPCERGHNAGYIQSCCVYIEDIGAHSAADTSSTLRGARSGTRRHSGPLLCAMAPRHRPRGWVPLAFVALCICSHHGEGYAPPPLELACTVGCWFPQHPR
jgi:hypothetical protein